jgi:hypothetical protein
MASIKRLSLILITSCAGAALSACDGANDIASPGTGGNVIINNPAPAPTPTPTPTPVASVNPAAGCPSVPSGANALVDAGVTQATPIGSWRICQLPAIINKSMTLAKIPGLIYSLNGRVDVGCDGGIVAPTAAAPRASSTVSCTAANGFTLNGAGQLTADTNVTLTIDPGVIIAGYTGTAWLAVNRGNKINAVGSATAPIVFTSKDNVLGLNNDTTIGQWGGVVLMGRAKVTDCTTGSVGAGTCERQTEGSTDAAVFGGTDDAYNAGTMKYVQIRYSGYVLGANVELQGLTTEGVGSGTALDFIQSHNSSDDGAEFFGGTVRFKHYVATGADDDSLDVDTGLQGFFQYVLLVQRPGQGDALMEVDTDGFQADTPRQVTKVVNFTALQSQVSSNNEANDQASILLRGNADLTLANGLVISASNECLRISGTSANGSAPASLVARSVALQCNATKYIGSGSYTAAQVATAFGTGANGNNDGFTNTLTGLFINGASETALPAIDAKTLDAFFDTTTYVGAVKDANDNWFKGWTCNSSYATFDGTGSSRSCTSLPTN